MGKCFFKKRTQRWVYYVKTVGLSELQTVHHICLRFEQFCMQPNCSKLQELPVAKTPWSRLLRLQLHLKNCFGTHGCHKLKFETSRPNQNNSKTTIFTSQWSTFSTCKIWLFGSNFFGCDQKKTGAPVDSEGSKASISATWRNKTPILQLCIQPCYYLLAVLV